MKNLNQFSKFDWDKFVNGKTLMHVRTEEWTEYETGKHLGIKVYALITTDNTDYGNVGVELNLYEKLVIKVPRDLSIPKGAEIVPVNVVSNVYGEYRNQLSITAEDIEVTSE